MAAGVLLLGAPLMASPSAEAIDESTLSFFLAENFSRVKEEEVKELEAELATKERVLVSEVERFLRSFDRSRQLTAVEHRAVAWFVAKSAVKLREKRKKKRRKRRLLRGVWIRRCGQGSRSRSSFSGAQCSFLLSTGLRCSASWPVCTRRTSPRSSSFVAAAHAVLVCLTSLGPGCSASWPIWTRRTVLFVFVVYHCCGMCKVGFPSDFAPRAVFFPPFVRPRCSASLPEETRWTVTWRDWRTWCSWFRLQKTVDFPQLQSIKVVDTWRTGRFPDHRDSPVARGYGGRCPFVARRAVFLSLLSSGPDARHDQIDSYVICLWFRLHKIVESPQLQSIKVVEISFGVHRPSPMVLAIIETPQLRVDTVVDALVTLSFTRPLCATTCRRLFCRDAVQFILQTAVTPQLQFISKVVDVLVCRFSKFSGAVCEETVELPQLQHVEAWTLGRALCTGTARVLTPAIRAEKGLRGRWKSDSQVTCHPNQLHAAVWH